MERRLHYWQADVWTATYDTAPLAGLDLQPQTELNSLSLEISGPENLSMSWSQAWGQGGGSLVL